MSPARRSIPEAARDTRTWAFGTALVVLVVVQVASVDDGAGLLDRLVFTVVPMGCLWLAGSVLVRGRRSIAATALLVAISPAVFTSAVAGERHGALAVIAALLGSTLANRRGRADVLAVAGAAVFVAVGLVVWWSSGTSRGRAPGPTWGETVGDTGDVVARGFAVVGPADLSTPMSGSLAWWGCVGIVAGAALTGRRPLAAATVPVAVAVFVVASWSITYWRGPVDPAGGMFLVAGAVAFAGASSMLALDQADRIARLLAIAGPAVWAVSIVKLLRVDDAAPLAVGASALAAAIAAAALWPRAPGRLSGESGS
jgi:hypothetical protein